jgi:preprotein translocase subunit SecY
LAIQKINRILYKQNKVNMKWNNILHALAAVGAVVGIFTAAAYWPCIALIWIAVSFINAARAHQLSKEIEKIDSDRKELISNNIKLEGRLWDAEMKSAKLLDKLEQK